MGQERRQFTDEFKREAAALLASRGRPLLQIASEPGISRRCCATGATAVKGGMRGRHRLCILPRTRQRRSPGFAVRTTACAWSATF